MPTRDIRRRIETLHRRVGRKVNIPPFTGVRVFRKSEYEAWLQTDERREHKTSQKIVPGEPPRYFTGMIIVLADPKEGK